MRKMTEQWKCTTATVMRAHQELARQGLVVSRVGKGTKVVDRLPERNQTPLRRVALHNRAEATLLEIMTAGYTPDEVELSLRAALDRWRTFSAKPAEISPNVLRFAGSHDPAMTLIAVHFQEVAEGYTIQLFFTGSLGGLIALVEKNPDIAGCHLWDENMNTYNEAFVRKLLPGDKVALLTLAHRRMGMIVAPGNPCVIRTLKDLARSGIRFISRQSGSGTHVWLDAQLRRAGINPDKISGDKDEKLTHSEVAGANSTGLADVGLGAETAALSFGLDFLFLTVERYDLVIPAEKWDTEPVKALHKWLNTAHAKAAINDLGGYDTGRTGKMTWVS
jgi:putative molybdopterin biosynthesis protein